MGARGPAGFGSHHTLLASARLPTGTVRRMPASAQAVPSATVPTSFGIRSAARDYGDMKLPKKNPEPSLPAAQLENSFALSPDPPLTEEN